MTGKVIQGSFLSGQPKLPSPAPARVPPPIQAKTAVGPPFAGRHGPPTSAFTARPPGPPAPAFAPRPPGPPTPAFAGRPGTVQRHGAGGAFAVEAGELGLASVGGRSLPDAVCGKMEAALGADFSNVRVHVGPQAERIGAIAFTIGSDIYFAPGRYQPDTVQGQQLLGHELAHVMQQRAGRVRNPLGTGLAVVQDHALEAEADRLGHRAAAHRVITRAKMPPGAAQPSAPVQISPPNSTGSGRYRIVAGAGGRAVGSVMVHARDKGAVEVTDLNVAEAQRGHGIGQMLVTSAARTGQQFGKSKMTLAAQDNGTGHLTQWYKGMGFTQIGVNQRGYPQLEAPISRILAGAAQRHDLDWQRPAVRLSAQTWSSKTRASTRTSVPPATRFALNPTAQARSVKTGAPIAADGHQKGQRRRPAERAAVVQRMDSPQSNVEQIVSQLNREHKLFDSDDAPLKKKLLVYLQGVSNLSDITVHDGAKKTLVVNNKPTVLKIYVATAKLVYDTEKECYQLLRTKGADLQNFVSQGEWDDESQTAVAEKLRSNQPPGDRNEAKKTILFNLRSVGLWMNDLEGTDNIGTNSAGRAVVFDVKSVVVYDKRKRTDLEQLLDETESTPTTPAHTPSPTIVLTIGGEKYEGTRSKPDDPVNYYISFDPQTKRRLKSKAIDGIVITAGAVVTIPKTKATIT
jgi:ribosomal protein S18 acetylase RimI-like enzyme